MKNKFQPPHHSLIVYAPLGNNENLKTAVDCPTKCCGVYDVMNWIRPSNARRGCDLPGVPAQAVEDVISLLLRDGDVSNQRPSILPRTLSA